jgi:hypothetical protein
MRENQNIIIAAMNEIKYIVPTDPYLALLKLDIDCIV